MADDYRVLLLAPTRRDREASLELLQRAGISATACEGARDAALQTQISVGALLMTDAAFTDPHIDQLSGALSRQPPWSEVPIILLSRSAPRPPACSGCSIRCATSRCSSVRRPLARS